MSNQTTKQNFKPTINKSAKQLVMKNAQQNAAGKMTQKQRDDALFEALGKNKKKKKRKILITAISIGLVVVLVLVVGLNALKYQVRNQFASSFGEVTSYTASTGTISKVVSGSGTLSDVDMQFVTVPNGVEIESVLVARNDSITEGQVLATVNMSTVISAMASLQSEIESLDKQIANAEDDKAEESILSGVSGRVKVIYAEADADVVDTMVEYGALALVSLDGYMAVDMKTDKLTAGDSVTVKLSGETEIAGTVDAVKAGVATILVSDETAAFEESVTIYSTDGTKLGSGELYIHNSLAITGFVGVVDTVHISLNEVISPTTEAFTLKETTLNANYETLLRSRAQKEESLLQLLTIQKNGAILAPVSGSVYSVDHSEDSSTSVVTLTTDESMSVTISIDESNILSLENGQEVDVYVTSVSEDKYTGTLTQINRTSSSSGTYSAVITLDKAEGMLSGMTASVSIIIEGVENAIIIPLDALTQTSSKAYVYTTYDEETGTLGGMVDVEIGISNSNYVEITSGLSEGDVVYYTESGSFGNMGGFPGGSGFPGNMGDFGDFGGFPGGDMGDFGGGFPGGGFPGGSFPGGFGS